ncbi:MAG TPA: glycosyltransferase family 2 protein [Methylomirabilota bacterium]|nr:glycosyltransferase family 2 protein [Methylomirabilota bacterium]
MNALIVIPVFDEASTVGRVVAGARQHGPVVVVDDGSRDDSADVAAQAGAEVLRHGRRLGKAQALLSGVAAARRRGATFLVTLDGDGQHDPAAIPALLHAAQSAPRAVVVGNRLDGPGTLPVARRNAIHVASFFASWTSRTKVRDSQSGFRVYPLALFDEVRTRRGGFVFETEILLAAAARGWAVEEVGVAAIPRGGERSRFRPLRDGVAIGGFLSGRVLVQWTREVRMVARELFAVFEPERLASRHAAILEAASPYADSPARWSAAFGAAAARRAGLRLGAIWRGGRQRGLGTAAIATLATPVTLPLLLAQAVMGERMPDVVSPLVELIYATTRVAADGAAPEGPPESAGVLVERS